MTATSFQYKQLSLCFTVAFILGGLTFFISGIIEPANKKMELALESRLEVYSRILENQNTESLKYASKLESELLKVKQLSRELALLHNVDIDNLDSLPVGGIVSIIKEDFKPSHNSTLGRYSSLEHEIKQELLFLKAMKHIENIDYDHIISGFPVEKGFISSPFGIRLDPINKEWSDHNGLDIAAPIGTKIFTTADGVVTSAGSNGSFGNMVEILHKNGFITRYAHCDELFVKKGQQLFKNEIIATVGNTGRSLGPHLHYEILLAGDVLDPAYFINR